MEHDMKMKKVKDYENFETRRINLERLFTEIRENRSQKPKSKKKGKKRNKKRKLVRPEFHVPGAPGAVTEPNDKYYGAHDSDDEKNYSRLYHEYKEIIRSKRSNKDERLRTSTQNGSHDAGVRALEKLKDSSASQQEHFEQKKGEYRKRYHEISDRLVNNIEKLNNNLNKSNKQDNRGVPHHHLDDKNDDQNSIVESDPDNITDEIADSEPRHHFEEEGDDHDIRSSSEQSLPQNSAREIIEAAAIFIQKNYRGYRTRKILREYIINICREGSEIEDHEIGDDEDGEDDLRNPMDQDEVYSEEYEDEADVDDDDRRYLYDHNFQNIPSTQHQDKNHRLRPLEVDQEEGSENEIEDEENGEEGEEEGLVDEDDDEYLGEGDKESLRSLLEKYCIFFPNLIKVNRQKLELLDDYNASVRDDQRDDEEEEDEEEQQQQPQVHDSEGEGSEHVIVRPRGEDEYRKLKDQYQLFYDQEEDLRANEDSEIIQDQVERGLQQDPQDEQEEEEIGIEDPEYFVPIPRRAKSDGEILEAYQFRMYDSDEDYNQISLHEQSDEYIEEGLGTKPYNLNKEDIEVVST